VLAYFVPHAPFDQLETYYNEWFSIVASFAIWLGALNLMKLSIVRISRKSHDWQLSWVVIACFLVIVVVGALDGFNGLHQEPPGSFRDPGTHFDWLYTYIYTPLSSTMFAILAFFVASASYRAFRARNLQATLLLVAGVLVMLGRVPLGDILTSAIPEGWQASDWASWIMNFPQTAGQRAIKIGVALGIVSTSLRIILGIERSHLEG
jgi:uncharacterized membrane protein YhaH (DUF805 family)